MITCSLALLVALIVTAAGSGIGVSQAEEGQEEQPAVMPEPMVDQIQAGYEDYVEAKEAREAALESPANAELRVQSRHAFEDLTSGELQELIRSTFGDVLEDLNGDPARFLSDATVLNVSEPDAATVRSDGDSSLFDAGIPVRAEDEQGNLRKVDVSLVMSEGDWVPDNPLVDLEIGASADEGLELGDEDIGITQVGAEDANATRLGDKNLLFSDVSEGDHTDLLVSPTARGVKLFDVLRSVDSPETLRFKFDLPAGSELRPAAGGTAEVLGADGEPAVQIPAPWARDAQGSDVPVAMTVEGSQLVLAVDHREGDFAYPILVDPEAIYQDWGGWFAQQNMAGIPYFTPQLSAGNSWTLTGTKNGSWPTWDGLAIATVNGTHGSGTGGYYIQAPNAGSYIAGAAIGPFWRNNGSGNCPVSSYPHPYDYAGLWNGTSWYLQYETAQTVGSFNMSGPGTWGTQFSFGLGTGGGYIPCWRHIMAGGIGIWLDDWQNPVLDYVGPTPEGWVKKDDTQRTFSVNASDTGLGVRDVRMVGVGTPTWHWNKAICAGTYSNRCPTSGSGTVSFQTNGFTYEGKQKFSIVAEDPTKKEWAQERTLWLDGTSPTINFSGQLATATAQGGGTEKPQSEGNDELSLPTYKLSIAANDGSERSGVKEIKVFLDSKTSPIEVKKGTCSSSGCGASLTMDYTLKLPGLSPGTHSLWVVAVDQAGNESDPERNIEFEYIPATGMKEEYVLQHFRLPDGTDYSAETEYHGPEIAVNVMSGNVVFHERDVEVETSRGELELERTYNSQQPVAEDTQWGRGWSIAQSPALTPVGGPNPQRAKMVQTGEVTNSVPLPVSQAQETFSSKLHAAIAKTAGGYEIDPETEDEVTVFDSAGRVEEVQLGSNATVMLDSGPPADPKAVPTFGSAFGAAGAGNGQFAHPAGIAIDAGGNVWVVDENNYRVQKFSQAGTYLASFGSKGSGNGQFNRPTDVAIDGQGNLWVTDAANNRLEQFTANGAFIKAVGTYGTGNGQFNGPESVAIDGKGNIWVGDTYNGRVQKLNSNGEFLKVVGSKGTGQGQIVESTGVAIAPNGDIWVADWGNNRVTVYSESGTFIRHVGSEGTADGKFKRPDVVEVDAEGNVWVGDQSNSRVQKFNAAGEFLAKFGTAGSGQGQFSFGWPMGLAVDATGNIWVADTGNNRVQRWVIPGYAPAAGNPAPYHLAPVIDYEYESGKLTGLQLEDEATGDEPSLDLDIAEGLVSAAEGEEAGATDYEYEAGKLKAVDGTDGETKFGADASGRMNSVELPNGTKATIVYDTTSRATSVTIDPAGPEAAKTTKFSYSAEPRRTIVWGGDVTETIYDIGDDGSVVKWKWAETPPTFDSVSGSLWTNRNSGTPIEDKTHTLSVTGSSPHQIGRIEVLVNGEAVVEEKTCADESEPPNHVCEHVTAEWITTARAHPAGRLEIEVVLTDFGGREAAERFFVTVPQLPPLDPEVVPPPDFFSVKQFREDNGLDRFNPLTEQQMNQLVLELLYEWEGLYPAAVAGVEGWGIPMRTPELQEMEFRRAYVAQASQLIPAWAEANAPGTYGGITVDDRAGGVIHVGFTQEQGARVAELKSQLPLMAPSQVTTFDVPPPHAISSLRITADAVSEYLYANPSTAPVTSSVFLSPDSNQIEVGATNVPLVAAAVSAQFGPTAPIKVSGWPIAKPTLNRFDQKGPVLAGSAIAKETDGDFSQCTAGFGARDNLYDRHGRPIYMYFTLTAAHCFKLYEEVKRQRKHGAPEGAPLGIVRRKAQPGSGFTNDIEAIRLENPASRSGSIFVGNPHVALPMRGAMLTEFPMEVCWSGSFGGIHCGKVIERSRGRNEGRLEKSVLVRGWVAGGDSGGPVWDPITRRAVGLLHAQADNAQKTACRPTKDGLSEICPWMFFDPLRDYGGARFTPGGLATMGVELLRDD